MPHTSPRQVGAYPFRRRRPAKACALVCLSLAILFALASCDAPMTMRYHAASGVCRDFPRSFPAEATFTCYVTFAPSVTYAQALRIITDAEMTPTLECGYGGDMLWQPAGQRDLFARWHSLIVLPDFIALNPVTGRSWVDELRYYLPGVIALHEAVRAYDAHGQVIVTTASRFFVGDNLAADATVSYTCPPTMPNATITPATLTIFSLNEIDYARVSFAPAISYDAALFDITDLGLRLANPCFETATVITDYHTADVAVDQLGQSVGFARAHALIVATTGAASAQWLRQARGVAGATGVTPVGGAVCAQ